MNYESFQSVVGHPVDWVNNQFRQYVYDVTELLAAPTSDTNLTVSFESAWLYGLNVTARPDVEPVFVVDVSTILPFLFPLVVLTWFTDSSHGQGSGRWYEKRNRTSAGIL